MSLPICKGCSESAFCIFWKGPFCSSRTTWNNFLMKFVIAFELYYLTVVLLKPDIPCFCKQCRSRSVGLKSQLIWICTVCHLVSEFISTIWIFESDWLKIGSGHGILIYSAWQGLIKTFVILDTCKYVIIFIIIIIIIVSLITIFTVNIQTF